MDKKIILAISLWIGLLVTSQIAYAAPDRTGKVDAGINVSGTFLRDSELKDAAYVGGSLAYGINEWLAVGVESGWFSSDDVDKTGTLGFTNLGELRGIPLLGDIILRMPLKDQSITPYGTVGLGAIFWDYKQSSSLTNLGVSNTNVDTSFAVKFGSGIDWFLNKNWVVNFEGSYTLSDATLHTTVGSTRASTTANTDYWMVGGGIKYLFD